MSPLMPDQGALFYGGRLASRRAGEGLLDLGGIPQVEVPHMLSVFCRKYALLVWLALILSPAFVITAWGDHEWILRNLAVGVLAILAVSAVSFLVIRQFYQRLDHVAERDSLTGLLNRHAFGLLFEQAICESLRNRTPVCVIFLALDQYPEVRERHGRMGCDRLVLETAALLDKHLREGDVLSYWGTDEFMVLLKNTACDAGVRVAEKLRHALALDNIRLEGELIRITASIGVAEQLEGEGLVSLFARVDSALYAAKANGRNRVAAA
ncbi:GGDEF domain-containing protein [Cellvibrio japonicus]|nr:GGDEF domain-containing protein [Cellvibrio japonicus]QEI16634.1 GGDEF domain-containing protein [Cellvibrio japonicus]QEI20212.1 GGDEF domain-containing protein [Cellvibrio japonicus]